MQTRQAKYRYLIVDFDLGQLLSGQIDKTGSRA